MPKGPKGEKRPADVIGNAVKVMRIATGEEFDTVPDGGADGIAFVAAEIVHDHNIAGLEAWNEDLFDIASKTTCQTGSSTYGNPNSFQ